MLKYAKMDTLKVVGVLFIVLLRSSEQLTYGTPVPFRARYAANFAVELLPVFAGFSVGQTLRSLHGGWGCLDGFYFRPQSGTHLLNFNNTAGSNAPR